MSSPNGRLLARLLAKVDHLVWAAPDLEEAVDGIEALLGTRPVPGGRHPRWGTRNALLALGEGCYLEVIGPDPERPDGGGAPTLFGIDRLTGPRLAAWCVREDDLDAAFRRAVARGVPLGTVSDGRRETPDGRVLSWRLTDPEAVAGDGLVPFLIAWDGEEHPAAAAPSGGRLVGLRAEHPEPEPVRGLLRALELPLEVTAGPAPALVAVVEGPDGPVELR